MNYRLLIIIAILIFNSSIFGQFINDVNFSDDGFFIANPHTGGNDQAITSAIERLPDGKYLIAGSARGLGGNSDFAMTVQRVNADGTVDTSFASDGVWAIAPNGENAMARGMVVQPDGKIVVAGYTTITIPASGRISRETVVRLNPDGSLDNSFADNGIFIHPHPITERFDIGTEAFDVELMANGNIVTGGNHRPRTDSGGDPCHNNEGPAPPCSAIAIYSPNGTEMFRDYFDFGIGVDREFLSDIEIQSDGKIVASVGYTSQSFNDFSIVRFHSSGAIDTAFGTNGLARTSDFFGRTNLQARSVKIQPDGKILLTGGTSTVNSHNGLITARFNANGTLDNSYGIGGKTEVMASGSRQISGESTIILDSGKILSNGARDRLVRLNPDGAPDSSFGDNGVQTISPPGSVGHIADMILQFDGKIAYTSRTTLLGVGAGPVDRWQVGRLTPNSGTFDFDGDSKTDVSIFRPSVGQWWQLNSSDGGNSVVAFGNNTDKLVPADYTGDGVTDVAFWRPASGEWFVLRSEDNSFYSVPFGTNGDIPVPGDFDGDEIDDIAVFRPSTSTWFINRSSDANVDIIGFGANGDQPIVSDYDGDGKADIAIYRPSVSQWWIDRSQDGVIVYQFGTNTDKQVPADYTGDGKTDVAFWRPASGEWFVIRSEDQTFYSFPFGTNGDIPSLGDYDGDGQFDAAVFRPSSNTWFINGTTSGTQIIGFGGSGDIPVPSVYVP